MSSQNGVDFSKCLFNWQSKSVILLLGLSIGLTGVLRPCLAGYVMVERAQPLAVLLMTEPGGSLEPKFEIPVGLDYGVTVEPTSELANEPTKEENYGETKYVAYDQEFGRSSQPNDVRDSVYASFTEPAYQDYNFGLKPEIQNFNEPTLDFEIPSNSRKIEMNIENDHLGKEFNSGNLESEVPDFEDLPMVEQSASDYLGTDKRVRVDTDLTTFDLPKAPEADMRSRIENQQESEIESILDSAIDDEIDRELEAEVDRENKIEQEVEFERELKQESDDRLEKVLETKLENELEHEIEDEMEHEIEEKARNAQGIDLNEVMYDFYSDQSAKPLEVFNQPTEIYDYFSVEKPKFDTNVPIENYIEQANDNLPQNNISPTTGLEIDKYKSFERVDKTGPSLIKGQLEVPYLPYPHPSIEHGATISDDDDDDDVDHDDNNNNSNDYDDEDVDDDDDDDDIVMNSSVANKRSAQVSSANRKLEAGDVVFVGIVFVCTGSAVFGLVAAGLWWRKVHSDFKAAQPVEYGADVGGHLDEWEAPYFNYSKCMAPVPSVPGWVSNLGDKYKNWRTRRSSEGPPIILQTDGGDVRLCFDSQEDLTAEDEEDECPVYECPGLAATSNVEVSNPLFKSNSFDEGLSSGYMKLPSPVTNDRRISAPTEMIKKELRNLK